MYMASLLLALSPFIVSAVTGWLKSLPPFTSLMDAARTPAVRVLAAVLAVVYVLLGAWMTGNVDGAVLSTSLTGLEAALLAWLGSLGLFHAFFQKKA